jgi:N-acyl-D-aspartate/D-glutamate deacylase
MSEEYDVLIKNAFIVDGTGAPGYRGSVAVKGERIIAVGDVKGGAETAIDAKGMAVTPGFIDVHNHGDQSIMYYPKADGYVRQGITTFVGGNCGSSPGPFGDLVSVGMMASEIIQELSPDMYYPSGLFRREVVNPRHRELFGWEIDWHTLGEFFRKLKARGISPNFAPLLGHHSIRIMAMGTDHKRKATPAEVEEMKKHVRQAMIDGCLGMSAGRDYDSYYADFEELVALAKVVAEYGGLYACHSLRTGLRRARRPGEPAPIQINGLLETIDVGRKAKVPVQVSHLGALYGITPPNPVLSEASAKETLKIVDNARKEGIDVTFDVIPGIRAFGTSSNIWLVGTLLPWLRVTGSREQLAKALRMKEFRGEIKDRIWEGKYYGLNPNINPNWAGGINILESKDSRFVNKTIAQIAKELGIDPLDALMDVIVADPYAKIGSYGRGESPTRALFYQHPCCMVGIDTLAIDTSHIGKTPPWSLPSENSFGGFALYFKLAVRENKVLTLEEAVRKVTSLPAAKFKLRDRGVLKPGAYADIVVMDPATVDFRATPLNPCVYPEGIPYVFVNGKLVVKDRQHTGATPGKVLQRE